MNARSRFRPIVHGLFSKPYVEDITDRRGAIRTLKFFTGLNKGKRYPYRSKKRGG